LPAAKVRSGWRSRDTGAHHLHHLIERETVRQQQGAGAAPTK
jgi:hypothetical protein